MSGAVSSGRVRMKAPPSAKPDVSWSAPLLLEARDVLGRHGGAQARPVGEPGDYGHHVVVEVASDRQVQPRLDAQGAQLVGGTDARQQQQVW